MRKNKGGNHGKIMWISREHHGNITGTSWEYHYHWDCNLCISCLVWGSAHPGKIGGFEQHEMSKNCEKWLEMKVSENGKIPFMIPRKSSIQNHFNRMFHEINHPTVGLTKPPTVGSPKTHLIFLTWSQKKIDLMRIYLQVLVDYDLWYIWPKTSKHMLYDYYTICGS